MKCFDCEKSMRRLINKNTFSEKEYFICSTYSKIDKDFCTRHYIEKEKLEKILLSIIQIQIKLILEVDKLIIEIKSKNIIENDEKNLKAKIKCIENKIQNQNEYKKILYESWKLKKISKEKYHKLLEENQNDLLLDENKLIELEKNLLKINQMKNYDSAWISLFKQKQNIKELDKDVLEELIDTIYIHENNKITVKFKYEDEYKRTINLLKTVNEHHTGKEKQYEQKK